MMDLHFTTQKIVGEYASAAIGYVVLRMHPIKKIN